MKCVRAIPASLAVLVLLQIQANAAPPAAPDPGRLIVHEWGTFTVLQDESGRPIGGVNTDDEPLPQFVHSINPFLIQTPSEVPSIFFKGWPRCDRDVLARLETPVIYFHPATGVPPAKLDVRVDFHGGWLTQYFPDADVRAPGLTGQSDEAGALTASTLGGLTWKDLTVGGMTQPAPATAEKVWAAPRQVEAADVQTPAGESDRFLFYRGVGHFNAPLSVQHDAKTLTITFDSADARLAPMMRESTPLWMLDVRPDGTSAMKRLAFKPAKDPCASASKTVLDATLVASDYSAQTLGTVRKELFAALIAQGLFKDEANALLNTWQASYFQRPGMRLFFMVPQAWTDDVLPLHIDAAASASARPGAAAPPAPAITRVMVDRIELVTPDQRELLAKIAAGPVSDATWVQTSLAGAAHRDDYYRETWYAQLMDGHLSLLDDKFKIPEDFRAYLKIGRFRNALILDEEQRHPSANLEKFIANYKLAPFKTTPSENSPRGK